MFRFEEPTYLYLLLLLPFLAVFYLYSNYRRRKNIRRFGDPVLLAQLMPTRPDEHIFQLYRYSIRGFPPLPEKTSIGVFIPSALCGLAW